jgi:hypothetical protein
MRIYVDADGFPGAVKDILIRAVLRVQVPLVFVANKPIRHDPSELISSLIVPGGPDIADDRIAADIPLADRVVAKGAFALNPRGQLYSEENIKDRLALRDLLATLRDGGLLTGGPPPFSRKDCRAFADQLDRFLVKSQMKKEIG